MSLLTLFLIFINKNEKSIKIPQFLYHPLSRHPKRRLLFKPHLKLKQNYPISNVGFEITLFIILSINFTTKIKFFFYVLIK